MGGMRNGLIAGALATLPMTVVILVSRWLGLFRTLPPEQIARNAADEVGLEELEHNPAFGPIWLLLHEAFGTGCGALYQAVGPLLPPRIAGGILYGLGVWAVNYLGIMPALGLFPAIRRAGRRRTTVMIVAHLVYGAALALLAPARRHDARS